MTLVGEKTQLCRRCRKRLPATTDFFRKHRTVNGTVQLHKVCRMCESARRHGEDRWIRKARSTIYLHRDTYAWEYEKAPDRFPHWDGKPLTFAEAYGWNTTLIAGEMEAAFNGPCKGCGYPYKAMGHGPRDLTVDIIDPTREPFYAYNARLVCESCNSHKGKKTPDEETRLSRAYVRWAAMAEDHFQPLLWPTTEPPAKAPEPRPAEQKPAIYEAREQLKLFDLRL